MKRCSFCAEEILAKYFHAGGYFKTASLANGTQRTRDNR